MIAARLAGGNLFLPFWVGNFVVGDFLEHSEQLGALGFFLVGIFLVGIFGSTRSSSEHSDFFEGIFFGGFFFWGWWGVFWIESVGKN